MYLNLVAGWLAIFLGVLTGISSGLYFHKENFLGGYGSWTRRLMRLGHISFFGLGILNILFTLSASALEIKSDLKAASILFVVGLCSMPIVCYASAIKKIFRNLFFIPVLSTTAALMLFLWRLLKQ